MSDNWAPVVFFGVIGIISALILFGTAVYNYCMHRLGYVRERITTEKKETIISDVWRRQ